MSALNLSPDEFARVFGPTDDLDKQGTGRSRLCRSCGGWHRLDKPWPHNCRAPSPPRNPNLTAPQLAPSFGDGFVADPMTGEAITSRNEKREYMARNDVVEYDAGTANDGAAWVRERDQLDHIEQTIRRFSETDMEYWTPEERGEVAPTTALGTGGQDVDPTAAESAG